MRIKVSNFCNYLLILQFAYLFVKVPRLGINEVTFTVFESSCHLIEYKMANHHKVEATR